MHDAAGHLSIIRLHGSGDKSRFLAGVNTPLCLWVVTATLRCLRRFKFQQATLTQVNLHTTYRTVHEHYFQYTCVYTLISMCSDVKQLCVCLYMYVCVFLVAEAVQETQNAGEHTPLAASMSGRQTNYQSSAIPNSVNLQRHQDQEDIEEQNKKTNHQGGQSSVSWK